MRFLLQICRWLHKVAQTQPISFSLSLSLSLSLSEPAGDTNFVKPYVAYVVCKLGFLSNFSNPKTESWQVLTTKHTHSSDVYVEAQTQQSLHNIATLRTALSVSGPKLLHASTCSLRATRRQQDQTPGQCELGTCKPGSCITQFSVYRDVQKLGIPQQYPAMSSNIQQSHGRPHWTGLYVHKE
jgi:hypothetical protein